MLVCKMSHANSSWGSHGGRTSFASVESGKEVTFKRGNSRVGAGDDISHRLGSVPLPGKWDGTVCLHSVVSFTFGIFLERSIGQIMHTYHLLFCVSPIFVFVFYESRVAIFTSVFSYIC